MPSLIVSEANMQLIQVTVVTSLVNVVELLCNRAYSKRADQKSTDAALFQFL